MAKEPELKNQKQPRGKFDVLLFKSSEDMKSDINPKVLWKYKTDRPRGYPKNPERETILREVVKFTKENPGTISPAEIAAKKTPDAASAATDAAEAA